MVRQHQSEPAIWMTCLSAARVPRSLASRRRALDRVCSGRGLSPKLATRAFLGPYRRILFNITIDARMDNLRLRLERYVSVKLYPTQIRIHLLNSVSCA